MAYILTHKWVKHLSLFPFPTPSMSTSTIINMAVIIAYFALPPPTTDQGQCYPALVSWKFLLTLIGLGRFPILANVLPTISTADTTHMSSSISSHHRTAHVHRKWTRSTLAAFFHFCSIGAPSNQSLGISTITPTPIPPSSLSSAIFNIRKCTFDILGHSYVSWLCLVTTTYCGHLSPSLTCDSVHMYYLQ